MMEETFVRITDIGKVLLEYIGSEDYLKAVESIQDSGKAAFMGGIGMAGCVIMSRCQKFYAQSSDNEAPQPLKEETCPFADDFRR